MLRCKRKLLTAFCSLLWVASATCSLGQAALLLEQPYGVFGTLNPTGHAAIYLEHVCADTPVHLRSCNPDETGVVISRYKGMEGYDWIAIPLIPYLYAVDNPGEVPAEVDQDMVNRIRTHYKEARLGDWGEALPKGNFFYDGWVELVGTAYDRRTYAFRFNTTRAQDGLLIARLNDRPNKSHFNILFNNCADFDRFVLQDYFPGKFKRNIFPDAGITTPKRIAWTLVKYSKKHPGVDLTILEIPQVPGFRRKSRADRGVAETFFTNGYIVPILVLNPYVAGGLLADYLVQGGHHIIPKNPTLVNAKHLDPLIDPSNSDSSSIEADAGTPQAPAESPTLIPSLTQMPAQPENSGVPPYLIELFQHPSDRPVVLMGAPDVPGSYPR